MKFTRKFVIPLFFNDIYKVTLPLTHRFPMQKYRMVRDLLQQEYANNSYVEFNPSPCATIGELTTTHSSDYVARYFSGKLTPEEIRNTGFPWSQEHVDRAISSVGGTVAAMRHVLKSVVESKKQPGQQFFKQSRVGCHIAG